MLVTNNHQLQLSDIPFAQFIFKKDHLLCQLKHAICWDNLLSYLAQFYCNNLGRPTNMLRATVGTEIIKRLYHLSDRKAVHFVEENMYAHYFCDITPSQAYSYMNPANGLANFRKQIGKNGLLFIHQILQSAASKKPLKRGNALIIDTTCIPLDIIYPTDIRLLERCRKEIIQLMKKAKQHGIDFCYRTYSRIARKVFLRFSKLAKPKNSTIKKVHKQLLQFLKRNFNQLMDLRTKVNQKIGHLAPHSKPVHSFLLRFKQAENKIRIILHQQKLVYLGNSHINNRIVSFHKDHCRPIVRGKFPLPTEFGPKVLLALVKGYTYVIDIFQHNVADATLILPALKWFKKTFGKFPKKLLGDRGFFSRKNIHCLKFLSILSGLQQKGKSLQSSLLQSQMTRKRLPIEARISLLKRMSGWSRCRAKNSDHESAWILLQSSAMNVHLAARQGFLSRAP